MRGYVTFIFFAMVITLILLLSGCMTSEKAARQFDKDRPAAANYCAIRFPVRDSVIKGDTVYLPGKNPDVTGLVDSIRRSIKPIYIDTSKSCMDALADVNSQRLEQEEQINKQASQLYRLQQLLKDRKPDTVRIKGDIVYRENTAKVEDLQYKLTEALVRADKMERRRNWWRKACLITWGIIAAVGVGYFLKRKYF